MIYSGVRSRAPRGALHRNRHTRAHSAIVHTSSSSGHVIIKPASTDEHLLVHPCDAKFHLVLTVEPATLQAATLMQATRDASVDRCPPAATLQLPVGGWSVGCGSRGPSARLHPHKPACLRPEPSHSRPLAAGHCPGWLFKSLTRKSHIMPHTSRGQTEASVRQALGMTTCGLHVVEGGTQGTRGGVVVNTDLRGE